MNPESQTIIRQLEQKEFEAQKLRMEKYNRIAADLTRDERHPHRKQRMEEIKKIEARIIKSGRGQESEGRRELLVDARGYRETRRTVCYLSPTGERIERSVVMFYKNEGSKVTWLTVGGRVVSLHTSLYDQRIDSALYGAARDRRVSFMPTVDERGIYAGIVTIIEDIRVKRSVRSEPSSETIPPGFKQSMDLIRSIADAFPFNPKRPRKPENYFPPIGGNIFNENDRPTLAGKMCCDLYDTLTERPGFANRHEQGYFNAIGNEVYDAFNNYVVSTLNARRAKGNDRIEYALDRKDGTDAFHFNGDTNTVQSFLFYFNKSQTRFHNPNARMVRAYITLDDIDLKSTGINFADLCLALYDGGVDFLAKCCSPYGQAQRMDNMVFYISESHRAHASEIIKRFLSERKLGKGHLMAATPSRADGLSWAYEPSEQEMKLWRAVSGSTSDGSFNLIATMYALPLYLDKLIVACYQAGDQDSAKKYQKEAERIRALFEKYRTVI